MAGQSSSVVKAGLKTCFNTCIQNNAKCFRCFYLSIVNMLSADEMTTVLNRDEYKTWVYLAIAERILCAQYAEFYKLHVFKHLITNT